MKGNTIVGTQFWISPVLLIYWQLLSLLPPWFYHLSTHRNYVCLIRVFAKTELSGPCKPLCIRYMLTVVIGENIWCWRCWLGWRLNSGNIWVLLISETEKKKVTICQIISTSFLVPCCLSMSPWIGPRSGLHDCERHWSNQVSWLQSHVMVAQGAYVYVILNNFSILLVLLPNQLQNIFSFQFSALKVYFLNSVIDMLLFYFKWCRRPVRSCRPWY